MSREWKPGDPEAAIISWRSKSGRNGGTQMAVRCWREYDESHWQTLTFGEISDDKVTELRPLVVIDPEDREQVGRLVKAFVRGLPDVEPCTVGRQDAAMQEALRSLIAPPKPEEPTGLGAVVEDATGEAWIRAARIKHGWHRPMGTWAAYDDIDAVKVLSEGVVTP